ncbi:MFS transporter [Shewanella sp. KX20019]|uniref:MFS transporter n=1 Tax=Shewanella sp. KX20019 TaxID=2803864 RepID=UPI001928F1EA|nr:MFS transporter [Shewanella sp. KX20019]QQX80172.1 MFS transporter [Shewanella sp. KX20019]
MLFSRRFLPYFMTQCLGALNDNVFKNVLLLMVSYSQVEALPIDVHLFVNLAAGLFILPFLLFSAHAGQVADSVDKAVLIRRLKALEFLIMSAAVFAILSHSFLIMLLLLFLMGTQSAYFGPVKYSLLPRVLQENELVSGNAWVEMGTFLAILSGTLSAGLIVASDHATYWAAGSVLMLALLGMLASWMIPNVPTHNSVKPKFSIISATVASIRKVRKNKDIWFAILAISWFWFVGATYLTQIPNFSRITLNADPTVVSLLLLLFSVGIGIGSFVCERLSFKRVELGVAPIGIIMLGYFGIDLYSALPVVLASDPVFDISAFIAEVSHYRLMFDLFMIGIGGGLFIVPLYTYIQARADETECAQAIASNNIINALFMVTSAIFAMLVLNVLQWNIEQLFLLLAWGNMLVLLLFFVCWPELVVSAMSYVVRRVLNRVTVFNKAQVTPLLQDKSIPLVVESVSLNWQSLLAIHGMFNRSVYFVIEPQNPPQTGLLGYIINQRPWEGAVCSGVAPVLVCIAGVQAQPSIENAKTIKCSIEHKSGSGLRGEIEVSFSV